MMASLTDNVLIISSDSAITTGSKSFVENFSLSGSFKTYSLASMFLANFEFFCL